MKISIVIINKNDWGVRETLRSIAPIIQKDTAECILVDASSHQLDQLKTEFPWVTWIDYRPSSKFKSSIPEQRNIGIQQAEGEIIVFLDASCVPVNKNWLVELTKPLFQDNEVIVRGTVANITNYVTVTEKINTKIYVTEAPTINIAIDRQVFDQIGLFDETFSYGSDMDFTWRATRNGYKIRYISSAPVTHNFGTTNQNVRRYLNYGKARAKLYLNHPYYINRVVDYELKSLAIFIALIFSPISLFVPIYVVIPVLIVSLHIWSKTTKDLLERVVFSYGMVLGLLDVLRNKLLLN